MSNPAAIWTGLLAVFLAARVDGASAELDPPSPPKNLATLGANIQRTMTLLATSTPKKRNRVKILFYGQSVTANPWWKDVADTLRKRYPHADLTVENRAIGGFTAPALIRPAEHDLYPFYPDLLIFHVYGGVETGEQEAIIARTRRRTTAEILLWTSHFRWPRELPRDGSPDDPRAQRLTQADERRAKKIRELARQYGCELAEVREQFRRYLKDHKLFPKDTLHDSVHPNKLGNFLIAELIKPTLRHDPKFPTDPWKGLVRDYPPDGKPVTRRPDGGIELTFEGNRVDAIAAHAAHAKLGTAKVLIDGKAPSHFPELYCITRPSRAPHVWWPAITRIDRDKPLLVEKWTLRVLEGDLETRRLAFEVVGSKTGHDGKGVNKERFVSNSGRVVIEPRTWMICHSLRYRKRPMPADFQVTWEVKPLFVDVYRAPKTYDAAKQYATMLAQGLSNTRHTLQIIPSGDGPVPIHALRVYRPPLR